jgi:hypothetical protein
MAFYKKLPGNPGIFGGIFPLFFFDEKFKKWLEAIKKAIAAIATALEKNAFGAY